MQLPISPAPKVSGHLLILTASLNCDRGVDRSGVKGPLICGSSVDRSMVTSWSYSASTSGARRLDGPDEEEISKAAVAIGPRCVECKYGIMLGAKGNIEVVAPTSAPILQIVAMPVQLMVCTPGPKYSMTKPVPPRTVKSPASFIITSFGVAQPSNFPSSFTPSILGAFSSHGASTIASTASAPPTPIAIAPNPPALGVWLSVPSIINPGAA